MASNNLYHAYNLWRFLFQFRPPYTMCNPSTQAHYTVIQRLHPIHALLNKSFYSTEPLFFFFFFLFFFFLFFFSVAVARHIIVGLLNIHSKNPSITSYIILYYIYMIKPQRDKISLKIKSLSELLTSQALCFSVYYTLTDS